ncbi:MAG: pseudouridine synthase, partial [Anaerolineae bacterium]
EDLIRAGRVQVNNRVVTQMGVKVDPRRDKILVDNRAVTLSPKPPTYIMLNKPRYVLSTTGSDREGRKTVLDLVKVEARVFPVGRLDFESEGLILLTTDGELAHRLTHPSFEHDREYEVLVAGKPTPNTLRRWRAGGFEVDGKPVGPMRVEPLSPTGPGWFRVILKEGRKRQIRTIAAQLNHPVITLVRVRLGPLKLGRLKAGAWRHLSPREVDLLRQSARAKKRPNPARRNSAPRHSNNARGYGE